MLNYKLFYVFISLICCVNCIVYTHPEQVHIAFGDTTNTIVVTWSTPDRTAHSIVEYGKNGLTEKATGEAKPFVDGGELRREQWIHTVALKNLSYDTKYEYHCGSHDSWSDLFFFKTPPEGENFVLRAAIYGDMGNVNAQSLGPLQEEGQRGMYDMILHVGDFAYDMDTDNAEVGDEFMRQIEPVAAYVPYMTCPGNHEEKYNFSNYKNRFTMPGRTDDMYYSFDIGPVHFISISTEYYYFLNYGLKPLVNQYYWLVEDLKKANRKENREKRPWILLYGHRPMYCSDNDDYDCNFYQTYTRTGLPFVHWFGMEKLLNEYGVDLVIWAHEHSYERSWPVYDYVVYNGSLEHPYTNPKAPVHIVTGSAGCQEGVDPFVKDTPAWSAFHSSDYGYTRFKAYNKTHIHMEQVSVNDTMKVIDEMWLIKDYHEPYYLGEPKNKYSDIY